MKNFFFFRLSKIEQAVILIGTYIALQMISDIAASKVIKLGPLVMDAGIIYSITFTWRDLIHKRLGIKAARMTIVLAGILNVLMAAYFYFVIKLPAEAEWQTAGGQAAWEFIFSLVPRITMASIIAEVFSELIDTEIYKTWVNKFRDKPQWTRVAVSNFISIPIDSFIFVVIAFSGILSYGVLLTIFISNIITKIVLTIPSFGLIYLVKDKKSNP